ncbi:MAG: hypothetical protein ACI4OI_07360, partial [Gemmiger sp.]
QARLLGRRCPPLAMYFKINFFNSLGNARFPEPPRLTARLAALRAAILIFLPNLPVPRGTNFFPKTLFIGRRLCYNKP